MQIVLINTIVQRQSLVGIANCSTPLMTSSVVVDLGNLASYEDAEKVGARWLTSNEPNEDRNYFIVGQKMDA